MRDLLDDLIDLVAERVAEKIDARRAAVAAPAERPRKRQRAPRVPEGVSELDRRRAENACRRAGLLVTGGRNG